MADERKRFDEVTNLSEYRKKVAKPKPKTRTEHDKLLDEISYHILMAAKAIARQSNM